MMWAVGGENVVATLLADLTVAQSCTCWTESPFSCQGQSLLAKLLLGVYVIFSYLGQVFAGAV